MSLDLSTTYLGLKLPHPFMPGASPLAGDLDTVRRLEDAGAAAIVVHSLFEEQIAEENGVTDAVMAANANSHAEASSFFPSRDLFPLGPEEYLNHVARVKAAVRVPVIASLNGTTAGGWLEYARKIEQAGADALELNTFELGADPAEGSESVERRTVSMVRLVKSSVKIPVAIKLSPFYTSLAHYANRLVEAGADGLVLFNRFFQPDIDVERLELNSSLRLSDSSELPLRLRWLALLSGRVMASLAVTGGVHTAMDAIKAVMAGAHAVQIVSALLEKGPAYLKTVRSGVVAWMEEHEYQSVAQMRGSMSLQKCPDPKALGRANYARMLQSWRK